METISETETLDSQIQRVLGFSPSLLGLTFARRWNLSEEILVALGDKQKSTAAKAFMPKKGGAKGEDGDVTRQKAGEVLAKICEVSEALARANTPELYPTALHDWEKAEEAIARHLGPSGVKMIFQRAQEHCGEYLKSRPELVDFVQTDIIKEKIVDSRYASMRLEKNVYLRACPPPVREKIGRVYFQLKPNKILKRVIRTFVHELVPALGFPRGCIFMIDPTSRVLSPSIQIGELPPDRVLPIKLSSTLSHFDLVSSAFSLKSPLREEGVDAHGGRITMIASAIGQLTPVGVLYLETSEAEIAEIGPDPMPIFRALRQCLNDCLNLP